MKNILVIAGHGNFDASTANNTLLDELAARYPEAEIRRLSRLYPDFNIDVAAEQAAIVKADVVVFQFPLNWYQTPAILKQWMDQVLAYGFAYGTGAQMGGKKFVVSYTAAAPDECYVGEAAAFVNFEHILDLFRASAKMCGMDFAGAVVENGYTPNPTGDAAVVAAQQAKAKAQAQRLFAVIDAV